jgi:PadR family transcriptional regulator PadR
MRRKPGALVPLEASILEAALGLRAGGEDRFHGFRIAKLLADGEGEAGRLTAHGTLYKALGRLEAAGLLTSTWEESSVAEAEGRPRRRLYSVTGAAEPTLAAHRRTAADPRSSGRAAWGLS